MKIEDRQVIIKDLKVYYRVAGYPKDPPLVLLNGWGARIGRRFSDRVMAEFARHGFHVYSPEHPGLMRSETPKAIWRIEEYVEYLEEFIEKLGVRNFILVGQSFGGAIATSYASLYPEKIRTLMLVNAALSYDKKRGQLWRNSFFGKHFIRVMRSSLPKIFKKIYVWVILGVPWGFIKMESFEARSIMGDIFRRWSLPNVYSKIRVKTILIWGSNDMLFPLSSAREVEKEIPNAKLYAVFGGHSILYTQPKRVVELIASKL